MHIQITKYISVDYATSSIRFLPKTSSENVISSSQEEKRKTPKQFEASTFQKS